MGILEDAHKASFCNGLHITHPQKCGCYYCMKVFDSSEIWEWVEDKNGPTAICPYCGIDTVLHEDAGYPLTKEFLEEMYKRWFP